MKVTKDFIRASDRHELYYEMYEPENPVMHVHILHGMAEHIGRYEEFAHFLTEKGFIVSGHDHRGHGKTAERNGTRGYFGDHDGFDLVVRDVYEVIKAVQAQIGELPLVLFGHSMGSFIARRYMQLHSGDLSRVVLSGTRGDPGVPGKIGLALAALVGKAKGRDEKSTLLGYLTVGGFIRDFKEDGSKFAWLSSDASEVRKYEEDPLSGFVSTSQFYADLFKGLALIHKPEEVAKVHNELPVLLISGAKDPVGDNGTGVFSSAKQYRQAGLADVTVFLAEQGRHELLHETHKQRHFELLAKWMLGDD